MEILHLPLTLLLYLTAAVLTARGKRLKYGYALLSIGGLFWAVGTVSALVDGVPLDEPLCMALLLLLLSVGRRKEGAVEE